ncbi:hypothetical protein ACH5RR_029557 [Cinchona calisaya]|uniref:UBA domain-containing protein n=1 Tax=Cinchona calisaya TaxID=153742 RepID=A0ABD2YRZ9_9GENT
METQMQKLISMGFPDSLASEALKVSGGDILKATDWILSSSCIPYSSPHDDTTTSASGTNLMDPPPTSTSTSTSTSINDDNSRPPPSPPLSAASSNFQPKIDRFFHFRPKTPTAYSSSKSESNTISDPAAITLDHHRHLEGTKRPRLSIPQEDNNKPSSPSPSPLVVDPLPPPPSEPLSERMRPRSLDEVVGQEHLLGPNSALRSAIQHSRLPSVVLWGPPGTGKTSIARAIVNSCSDTYRFVSLSAVNSGVKEVRDAVDEARKWTKTKGGSSTSIAKNTDDDGNIDKSWWKKRRRTVLFIDEVHRFNKAQQDSLLPVIEDGSIVFIGATTESPSFHLITPLLSRCTVLVLNPLKPHHITTLLERAVSDSNKGLFSSLSSSSKIEIEDEAIEFLSAHCDGDARVALNKLEISATIAAEALFRRGVGVGGSDSDVLLISLGHAKEALQCKHIAYDRDGEEHYNLISALHKSMRGSDADASIYWLARMLEGGEQPLYIARRLIRFASEDVGLADPSALTQAVASFQACHFIGMPECNVNLAQCVAYLALAPKSISVYRAIQDAQKVVRDSVGQNEGVPLHLRNAPTKLMKDIGYGKGYIYPPDNPNALSQTYMPPSLLGYKFLHWPNAPGSD